MKIKLKIKNKNYILAQNQKSYRHCQVAKYPYVGTNP